MIRHLHRGTGPSVLAFGPAGSSANFFSGFRAGNVWAVDYPRRGASANQAPARDRTQLVDLLEAELSQLKEVVVEETLFLGHSLGAAVAYELAHRLNPMAVWLSARNFPAEPGPDPTMSDQELIMWLHSLSPLPDALRSHPEWVSHTAHLLRHDLVLHAQAVEKLSLHCPVITFCGTDDPVASLAHMRGWHQEPNIVEISYPGGHHALHDFLAAQPNLLDFITN